MHVLALIPQSLFLFQLSLISGGSKSQISGCYTSIKQCPVIEDKLFYHGLEKQYTDHYLLAQQEN